MGTTLDPTNSSNITVREGLSEIEKWKPALSEDQWNNAQQVVLEDQTPDKLNCTLNAAGKFRVADYVDYCRLRRPKKEWAEIVWKKVTSARVNAFTWKVYRGALPVDSNVQSRGIPIASRCVCCARPTVETLDHLLVNSNMARSMWDHFAAKVNKFNRPRSIMQLREVWLHGVNRRSQLGMISLAILIYGMWEIWKTRCRMKFDEERFDPSRLLQRVYIHIQDLSRM